jgi:hypothetical protein
MFGQPATASDPRASYEVSEDHIRRDQKMGTRGFAGRPDTLTTAMTGANNDMVFTTKGLRPIPGSTKIQLGLLGPTAPLWLYEGGTPATLALNPNQGYQLVATFPGVRGNRLSLTVVDTGTNGPLTVRATPPGQITVFLARAGGVITTTAADLVAAINKAPQVNRWVMAWVSDATLTGALTALPQRYFAGGQDIPYLVFVSLVSGTDLVVTTTANQILTLMKGSELVTAALAAGNSGVGAVTVLGPAALTGGTSSRGEVSGQEQEDVDRARLGTTLGHGEGHQTNYGIEVEHGRQAVARTWKVVPTQDRAVTQSSRINHQMEHGPRSDRLWD